MKIIFFDLDDTLYFRQDAFFSAFKIFFRNLILKTKNDFEFETLMKNANDRCRIRGDEVFYQSQRGEITMQQMYIYRFQKGLQDCRIFITENQALEFEEVYKKKLYSLKINNDVKKLLFTAQKNFCKIGIITNGPKEHQWNKIKNLGLLDFVDKDLIIVSGEFGIDKPDLEIFKVAESHAKSFVKNDDVDFFIVGDSFCNDIVPAKKIGWKTIWLNLYNQKLDDDKNQFVDYTVNSICCVESILRKL